MPEGINPKINRQTNKYRFDVGQQIGCQDEGDKIGLTQPVTGADTLTKTDHGNYAEFNPKQ